MHLKAKDPEAIHYKVVDLNTGKDIPEVLEADDERGEYFVPCRGSIGQFLLDEKTGRIKTEKRLGRIKLVKVN